MAFNRRYWITLWVFGAIALVLLWADHRAHIVSALPWLIILLCPLMHIFVHGHHGGGHGGHKHGPQKDDHRE